MVFTMVLVDDNPVITEGMKSLITNHFDDIKILGIYKNGMAVIDDIKNKTIEVPDIIISDIHMPVADGIDICEFLYDSKAKTKVILITGYQRFEYARKALNLGVAYLLVKPFTSEDLLNCVKNIISSIKSDMIDEKNSSSFIDSYNKTSLINNVMEYVKKNYMDNTLSVFKIAEKFGFSSNYLAQKFKTEVGVSLVKYITTIRIEIAKKLLCENSKMSISDVAKQVGYTDEVYFHKVFKKTVGITPSQYKKAVKLNDKDI